MEGILTAAEWEALGLSLRIALVAVLADLPFAFLAALLLARGRFPGKPLVDGLVHLPLVLPPVALGYLLLVSFGTRAPLASVSVKSATRAGSSRAGPAERATTSTVRMSSRTCEIVTQDSRN